MRISRTLNYTDRKRINRTDVSIKVTDTQERTLRFDADLILSSSFPSDAKVFVEAYHRSTMQRFDFGTVGERAAPETIIDSIDRSGTILFRVKVVDQSGKVGRLIASAEAIRPREDDDDKNKSSLMHIRPTDLGQQTWRLELHDEHVPVLLVNKEFPDARDQVTRNPYFRGLILPQAFREVLVHILCEDESEEPEPGTWKKQWLDFSDSFAPNPRQAGSDSVMNREWIDDVVGEFCLRNKFSDSINKHMRDE